MISINDEQFDFILNDLSAQGIDTESVRMNLADHICCILEQEWSNDTDFKTQYQAVLRRFYRKHLNEIEEETHHLLTNKNYYVMKKFMIISGIVASVLLTLGVTLKYLHFPGAAVCITLGTVITSLLFLPLFATLKLREQSKIKTKILVIIGTLASILLTLAILFKIQHWPGANAMGGLVFVIVAFVYLPLYFFSYFRDPETRVNTIITSIIIVLSCGLFMSLTLTPSTERYLQERKNASFQLTEQLVQNELKFAQSKQDVITDNAKLVFNAAEILKKQLVELGKGGQLLIEDFQAYDAIMNHKAANEAWTALIKNVLAYNQSVGEKPELVIPTTLNILAKNEPHAGSKAFETLNDLQQIQLKVLQQSIK